MKILFIWRYHPPSQHCKISNYSTEQMICCEEFSHIQSWAPVSFQRAVSCYKEGKAAVPGCDALTCTG